MNDKIPIDPPPSYATPSAALASTSASVPNNRSTTSVNSDASTVSDQDDEDTEAHRHDVADSHRDLPKGWVREMDPT